MVALPAGSFTMGTPDDEVGRQPDEGPLHDVTFAKPFAISRYQITAGELGRLPESHRRQAGRRRYPPRPRMHRRQAALPARPSPAGGVRRLQRREELRRLAVEEDRQALPHAQRGQREYGAAPAAPAPSPSRSTKARNTASPSTPTPTAPAMATTSPRRWAASRPTPSASTTCTATSTSGSPIAGTTTTTAPQRRQRVDGGKVRAGADPRQRRASRRSSRARATATMRPPATAAMDRLPRGARTLTQNEEGRSDDTAPAFSNPSKEPGSELLGEQRQPFVQGREQAVVEVVPAQLEDGVVGEISVQHIMEHFAGIMPSST